MQNDDEQVRHLLSTVAEQPLEPSTVDVHKAIEAGKHRRHVRQMRMAVATASLSVVAAIAIPYALQAIPRGTVDVAASATPSAQVNSTPATKKVFQTREYDRAGAKGLPTACTGTKLTVPGGGIKSYVSNLDPSGRYVTGRIYNESKDPVLWRDGKPIQVPFGGNDDAFEAANTSGDAVGHSYPESGPKAWAYINAQLIELKGGNAEATGINDKGAIAGVLEKGRNTTAVVWPSADSQPVELEVPEGTETARANDIDEDGTTVGSLGDAGRRIAYVWYPDGTAQALPTPMWEGQPARDFDARRVRNGWVTGYIALAQSRTAGVRWDLVTGKVAVLDGLEWSNDVSPLGWIVGMDHNQDAVLTDGINKLKLPNVFPKPTDYGMNWGEAISDDGLTIAGHNDDRDNDGQQRGVLWKCR